jgi:hypothetical protein
MADENMFERRPAKPLPRVPLVVVDTPEFAATAEAAGFPDRAPQSSKPPKKAVPAAKPGKVLRRPRAETVIRNCPRHFTMTQRASDAIDQIARDSKVSYVEALEVAVLAYIAKSSTRSNS